jgi:hypothetical protein
MPTFDIYERKLSPSEEAPAQQMGMGSVQALHSAGQQAAQTMDYIGKVWDEAEYTAQYTTAKNNLDAQMLQFDADFKSLSIDAGTDGDYYKIYNQKKLDYQNRLNAIKQNGSTITNPRARQKYEQDAQIAQIRGNVMLEAAFRDKMIEHQKVELTRSGNIYKQEYLAGNTSAKSEYNARIEENFKKGFINEKEKLAFEEDLKQFELDKVAFDAQRNPEQAVEDFKEGKYTLTPEEQNKAQEIISAQYNQFKAFKRIENLRATTESQSNFNDRMFSEKEDTATLMRDLDKMTITGEISDDYAENARRYLRSDMKLRQNTNNDVMREYLLRIADMNEAFEEGDDSSEEDYLRAINIIRSELAGDNKLSSDDKRKVNNVLTTTSTKKQAQATAGLRNIVKYNDANEVFENQLPRYMRGTAMRKFFNATDGKDMDEDAQAQLAYKICDEIKGKSREDILSADRKAKETEPSFRIAQFKDKSGKRYNVKVYKDGKKEIIGLAE